MRLGRRIAAERARRRWSVGDLARAAHLSPRTVEYLEAGERRRYHVATLTKVETALGWAEGSITRIVEGAQPRPEPDALLAKVRDSWPLLATSERRVIATLVETLVGSKADSSR